jgi:hypothetical protein
MVLPSSLGVVDGAGRRAEVLRPCRLVGPLAPGRW